MQATPQAPRRFCSTFVSPDAQAMTFKEAGFEPHIVEDFAELIASEGRDAGHAEEVPPTWRMGLTL